MGSAFLSFDEAANRLGRSKRSVHNYVKRGFIKRTFQDGVVVLRREDVEQLAIELGADLPAMNRQTFFKMQARLERVENEMRAVKHILEIRDEPLRPSADEVRGVYGAARAALGVGKWSTEEVGSWANLFDRMDEGFLEILIKATQEQKAWVPIFELCLSMQKEAAKHFQSSLEWQARYKHLDEGRKKLRATIIVWTEMGRGTSPESLLTVLDDPKEGLIRKLSAS